MSKTTKTAPAKPTPSTNDSGRVKVGGGALRFATVAKPTHDAGRVQIGGGALRF